MKPRRAMRGSREGLMEYVVVRYPKVRDVRIDGQVAGKTNDTLIVEKGHHVFDLGEPLDYMPPSVEKNVQDTAPEAPLIVADFRPKGGV
jgi:hypothetical protein